MSAVATDAEAWNAETTTPPVLATLTAAAIGTGPVVVKAGWRSDTSSHGFQDCRSASEFQASSCDDHVNLWRMPVAPVRSPNERA